MFGFVCTCELCQDEEIKNDDETYEKFQNLDEVAENAYANFCNGENLDQIEKALACQKQMFNLAKNKKAPKIFIYIVLDQAFKYGISGFKAATHQNNGCKREYFKLECGKLSKVGYQIAKLVFGKEDDETKDWKERNEDFDKWFRVYCLKEFAENLVRTGVI